MPGTMRRESGKQIFSERRFEQIVDDGIYEKTHNMTPESMEKISSTLEKVMNENSGLVCLIV